jgi:hypothetical protein
MEIAVTNENNISIFAVKGRLDAVTIPELEQQLNQWFEGTGKKLIFDLEGYYPYSRSFLIFQTLFNLSELLTTETELKAIAAAANSGFSRIPKKG